MKSEEKGKKILSQIPVAEASLVAVDALDAELKAYVGGFDFSKSKFDRAAIMRSRAAQNLTGQPS